MTWQEHLRAQGYAHFRNLTPEPLVTSARNAIELDLNTNYEPERQLEYDNQSFCPELKGTPAIMNLLLDPSIQKILDETFGLDQIDWDKGQIAIRRAHNYPRPVPPDPHIDGFSSGLNGLDKGKIYNHTVLLGYYLHPLAVSSPGTLPSGPVHIMSTRVTFANAGRAR